VCLSAYVDAGARINVASKGLFTDRCTFSLLLSLTIFNESRFTCGHALLLLLLLLLLSHTLAGPGLSTCCLRLLLKLTLCHTLFHPAAQLQ
jgi:hypothetical protein